MCAMSLRHARARVERLAVASLGRCPGPHVRFSIVHDLDGETITHSVEPSEPEWCRCGRRLVHQQVNRAEIRGLRQIETELEAMPYQEGGTVRHANDYAGTENDWTDGDMRASSYVHARGGHPVYHDVLQAAPGTAEMTRGEVQAAIRKTLETGQWTNASKGALEVARQRLRADYSGPSVEQSGLGRVERVALPVDLAPAKHALSGLYDQWKRESEIVPLSMGGDKGRAFAALDRLMNGPDVASVSVVDQALSSLKTLARGANMPELRTAGQGGAAFAVGELDKAVRVAASKAGPDALAALEEGRDAHRLMRGFDPIIEQLQREPVQVYRRLTAPGDTQIGLLRQVSEAAPQATPDIARAWLDERLNLATERGRFEHADRLYADWRKLGQQTKNVLFPDPRHQAEVGQFFMLAKRLAENPNPSGTAGTLVKTGEAAGLLTHPVATLPMSLSLGALSTLLYSPRGARALVHYAQRTHTPSGVVPAALAHIAWIELANAARAEGLALPPKPPTMLPGRTGSHD